MQKYGQQKARSNMPSVYIVTYYYLKTCKNTDSYYVSGFPKMQKNTIPTPARGCFKPFLRKLKLQCVRCKSNIKSLQHTVKTVDYFVQKITKIPEKLRKYWLYCKESHKSSLTVKRFKSYSNQI